MKQPLLTIIGVLSLFNLALACNQAPTDGGEELIMIAPGDNYLYIGVDNTITIEYDNNLKGSIELIASDTSVQITEGKSGKYIVRPTKMITGNLIKLKAKVGEKELTRAFYLLPVPPPIAKVGGKATGYMGSGEMKAQLGVLARFEGFHLDAKSEVKGYTVTRISKDGDQEQVRNVGNRFQTETKTLLRKTLPGDIYLFENIKVSLPGSPASVSVSSIVIRIK